MKKGSAVVVGSSNEDEAITLYKSLLGTKSVTAEAQIENITKFDLIITMNERRSYKDHKLSHKTVRIVH